MKTLLIYLLLVLSFNCAAGIVVNEFEGTVHSEDNHEILVCDQYLDEAYCYTGDLCPKTEIDENGDEICTRFVIDVISMLDYAQQKGYDQVYDVLSVSFENRNYIVMEVSKD